jgi:hypothetical protein
VTSALVISEYEGTCLLVWPSARELMDLKLRLDLQVSLKLLLDGV